MSMTWMVRAFDVKVNNPVRKLILIKLADNANDEGVCWPSYHHIADQCECSERTAMNHIKTLEDTGFIRVQRRDGPKGNISNLYTLLFDKPVVAPSEGNSPAPKKPKKAAKNTGLPSENTAPPSANDSLPPSEGDSLAPCANAAPPSENAAPPPSENAAPRTYHSFEPPIEPATTTASAANSLIDDQRGLQPIPEHPVFSKSENHQGAFEMFDGWAPSETFADHCRRQAVNIALFDEAQQSEELGEFVGYWLSRPHKPLTQHGWEHKLTGHLKRRMAHIAKAAAASQAQTSTAEKRSSLSQTVMNISDTNW